VIQQICSILVYVFAHIGFLCFSKVVTSKMRCRRSLVVAVDSPAHSESGIQYQSNPHHFDQAYPRLASTLLHHHGNILAQTARLCCKFVVTGLMQRPASAAADSRLAAPRYFLSRHSYIALQQIALIVSSGAMQTHVSARRIASACRVIIAFRVVVRPWISRLHIVVACFLVSTDQLLLLVGLREGDHRVANGTNPLLRK